MSEALSIPTSIAIVLLAGLLITLVSKKYKISNVLLLIISTIVNRFSKRFIRIEVQDDIKE